MGMPGRIGRAHRMGSWTSPWWREAVGRCLYPHQTCTGRTAELLQQVQAHSLCTACS